MRWSQLVGIETKVCLKLLRETLGLPLRQLEFLVIYWQLTIVCRPTVSSLIASDVRFWCSVVYSGFVHGPDERFSSTFICLRASSTRPISSGLDLRWARAYLLSYLQYSMLGVSAKLTQLHQQRKKDYAFKIFRPVPTRGPAIEFGAFCTHFVRICAF